LFVLVVLVFWLSVTAVQAMFFDGFFWRVVFDFAYFFAGLFAQMGCLG